MFRLRWIRTQVIIGCICITVIVFAFLASYFLYIKQMKSSYQRQLDIANEKVEKSRKDVYVAKEKILFGEYITKDKLEKVEVFSSHPRGIYISDEDINKVSLVEIKKNMPIFKVMLTDSDAYNHEREEEFRIISLNSNLANNDYIDVRILFPNGENYIVLSKKAIKDISLEDNNFFMWLNEEETLRISSAIIDSCLYEGSELYTAKYIEPVTQEPSTVTYVPSREVIELIRENPNIVREILDSQLSRHVHEQKAIRMELESRIKEFTNWNKDTKLGPKDNQNIDSGETTSEEGRAYEEDEEVIYYYDDEE